MMSSMSKVNKGSPPGKKVRSGSGGPSKSGDDTGNPGTKVSTNSKQAPRGRGRETGNLGTKGPNKKNN